MTLFFVLGVFVARLSGQFEKPDFFDPIADVYRALSTGYVDKPDVAKLQKGAITGMLQALDDPYAEYIPPEDAANFIKQMTGNFSGIGCQIEMRDGWLTVVTPLEDSPAWAAGILSGDRITSIEGTSTFGLTSDRCVELLTGPPDTQVSFVVQRDGKEQTFTLTRKQITYRAVRGLRRLGENGQGGWDYMLDEGRKIGYIRLAQFTPSAPDEFRAGLAEARRAAGGALAALVLDLRGNPGGTLEAAQQIADDFLDDGVIVSVKGRAMPDQVLRARKGGAATDIPVCVLVDGGSASASEIVAGAIQDHERGVVVGTRTFGKGLVQTVIALPRQRNGQVKFTTQKYYLPSGRLIQRQDDSAVWGVDPSPGFFVPTNEEEVLARFLRRRDFDAITADGVNGVKAVPVQNWASPEWIAAEARDSQLGQGLRALQARLDSGEWQPFGEAGEQHGQIASRELRALEKTRERLGLEFARIDKRIEALANVAAGGEKPADRVDLWPDDAQLTDGRIEIRDAAGRVVARLRITGQDVERWLLQADVAPEASADTSATSTDRSGG